MRIFGNLMNRIAETVIPPEPEVGMECTVLMYSHRHAATVIQVTSHRNIVVQRDTATRTDKNGMSESQSYAYSSDPRGCREIYTKRKNGTWVKMGEGMKDGTILMVGERDEYYNYSF